MNLKQLSVLMILALFIMNVVQAAFADEGTGNSRNTETENVVYKAEPKAEPTTTNDGSGQRDRVKEAREKLLNTEKRSMDARKEVSEVRYDFIKARAKLHSSGGATLAEKKEFLLASIEKVLELLNSLKEKVEASEVDDNQVILEEIKAAITQMTDAKAVVDALDPATATRSELRNAAEKLKDAWKDARRVLKKGAFSVVNKRVGNVIQRMERLSGKLDRILAHFENKGIEVGAAKGFKGHFEVELASANKHWEEAKAHFASGEVQFANEKMRAAHADLKNAHSILKEILKSIRTATKPGDLEEAEEEVEDASNTEEAGDETDNDAYNAADDANEAGANTESAVKTSGDTKVTA